MLRQHSVSFIEGGASLDIEIQIKDFEEAVEKAFNGVRDLTHRYEIPEALIRRR